MHAVSVRVDEQTVAEEVGATVADQTVSLHLSHSQPAVPRSSFHGLPGEVHDGSPASAVDLVVHQVLQALVERWPQEHLRSKRGIRGRGGGGEFSIIFV